MLARRSETGVVSVGAGAELHSGDLQPPVIVLGQAQSQGVTAGMFKRLDTAEEFEALDVVPLIVRPSRVKWAMGGFSRDALPECWSDDGRVGSARLVAGKPAAYVGRACMDCPHYTAEPWAVDGNAGWCMSGYNVLLVDAQSYDVYILRLRGTATKLARYFAAKGIFQKTAVRLYAEHVEAARGSWYQMKAKAVRVLDEADRSLVQSLLPDYSQVVVSEGDAQEVKEEEAPHSEAPSTKPIAEVPTPEQRDNLPVDQRPTVKSVETRQPLLREWETGLPF